ncbi:tRNA (N6-isopentenyl adenosine(37)-C2)-methylthiotransferase MiaB [bacterium]|nr:tRNA (N6-isopentenyl adenosine(37)-C2)-methylthiotransferase MiaB [bacterium]QQR58308.1 MAG: tRNA (N6-isopentenyl adenosine(37)-C2)-methylthiotransferase MiaB [Candidatus Melainabacteria bacterium]
MSTNATQTNTKSVYVETFGCQMNKSDSEHMLGLLDEIGYEQVDSAKKADLLILNTCAIRENAEDKLFSYLGVWRRYKEARPGAMIAVGGCVAQDQGENFVKRVPYVDLVFGTHNLHRLPELVLQAKQSSEPVVEVYQELPEDLPEIPVIRQNPHSAFVSIIYGCDYNCTYCIVPYVRGREKSRDPQVLLNEIQELSDSNYKEVILLGQNVTAYGHDLEPVTHLGELIELVDAKTDIKRIRFLTGHPRDLKVEIIDSIKRTPSACEYFHIPIQAGDNRTLRRMARGYQVDFYKRVVEQIRDRIPNASISTDLIVGFPGETEDEFLNTLRLVEELAFDACNTAAYSPRPHTPAANWPGQVSEHEKTERIRMLNTVVSEVSLRCNKRYLGRTCELLVEGRSERNPERMTGRTRTNKLVNFEGDASLTGQFVDVEITAANPWALRGKLVNSTNSHDQKDVHECALLHK